MRYDLVVEEPHVLLQREYRIRLALARGIKHPAAQCTVGLLFRSHVHAGRQQVRVREDVRPFDAQIQPRARGGLEQQCAGAVGQHPAQEVLLECELGVRLDDMRAVERLGAVVLREQAERRHFRAGDDGIARAARHDRHPAVLQRRGARDAHARGRHRFANRHAELAVNHDRVVGNQLIGIGGSADQARQVVEREAVSGQSLDCGGREACVGVIRLSRDGIDHVVALPDAVAALDDAAGARRALADPPQDRFDLVVLDRGIRQAHRAARDVGDRAIHAWILLVSARTAARSTPAETAAVWRTGAA